MMNCQMKANGSKFDLTKKGAKSSQRYYLSNLIVSEYLMLQTKFQGHSFFGTEVEDL